MKTGIYWQDPEYPAKGMDFTFDPSLVLYLPLHKLDGTSFMSKDAYGHLCAVTGALWTPRGRDFDGLDDYIDIPQLPDNVLVSGDNYTYEFWIKPTSLSGGWQGIKGQQWQRNTLRLNDDQLGFQYVNDGGASFLIAATLPSADVWYHIVATVAPGKVNCLYVNGAPKDTVTWTGDKSIYTEYGIGRAHLHNGVEWVTAYFDGLIGEVRIYNRALAPLEVQRNYLATKWRYLTG